MASINFGHREITSKIVYFGTIGAGTNTNVRTLHGLVAARDKSRLHRFGPPDSREESCFFEYVTSHTVVPGFATRFRVYSMPGGIEDPIHRAEVLAGTDGVVFVADARPGRDDATETALHELEELLEDQALSIERVPIVLQVNHGDAPDAQPADVVADRLLADFRTRSGRTLTVPVVAAVARVMRGVAESHDMMVDEIGRRLRDNLSGDLDQITLRVDGVAPFDDEDVIARHLANIETTDHGALALAVKDMGVSLQARYASMSPAHRIEVAFQTRDLIGTRPVHVVGAQLAGDQVLVDVVVEKISGGDARRIAIVLENRPMDDAPIARNTTARGVHPRESPVANLPERIEVRRPQRDFPPVWYGMAGIAGGTLIGLLAGYLVFSPFG